MIKIRAFKGVSNTKVILRSSAPKVCKVTVTPKMVCLQYRRSDLENVIFDGENVVFDGEQVVI